MQIKVKGAGTPKKNLNRSSCRTPLDSEGYIFWRACSLLDDQHSCAGVLGRIGVGASKFLGVQRIFAQIFPNLSKKLPCNFSWPFLWCDLQNYGLHLFFCKPWAPFFEFKQRWVSILPRFSWILPSYLGILFIVSGISPKFSEILPKFSGILPGFSTNRNFWRCACTPASYTTAGSQPYLSWFAQFRKQLSLAEKV